MKQVSRIAGLRGDASDPHRGERVEAMLRQARASSAWSRCTTTAGPMSLGWCGSGTLGHAKVGSLVAVFDGHIYNRVELGGTSDAELLAVMSAREGFVEALRRINGDFAAAVYDERSDTLWLGRDRLGVRPLYYSETRSGIAFASQPRALLAVPSVSPEVNRRWVAIFAGAHYRYFDNSLEQTPYAAIAQVPAGAAVRVANGRISKVRYWSLVDTAEITTPEPELAEHYRSLFLDAVAVRLNAASKPVFTLSSGLDSSSVLVAAAHLSGTKQQALSAVYADSTYDESDDIRPMLSTGIEAWHPLRIDIPDVVELVRRMVAVHDEPVPTATWLSHFLLCEHAARLGFEGVFGGLGGDELNAGEYEYFPYYFADLRAAGLEDELTQEIALWARYHDHAIFRKSVASAEMLLARLVDRRRPGRCLVDRARLTRYARALDPSFFELASFEPEVDHPFSSCLKNRTYQDLFRETAPCCLRAEDRNVSAYGLDHFLPFLDHRLVEFMFRVPGRFKIRHGVTKYLLREAMRDLLPDETRLRVKKTGWNAPAHVWFAGPLREPIGDLIHSPRFRERGIYRVKEVERLLEEHCRIVADGLLRENHMMFFWQLLNLETWLQSLEQETKE